MNYIRSFLSQLLSSTKSSIPHLQSLGPRPNWTSLKDKIIFRPDSSAPCLIVNSDKALILISTQNTYLDGVDKEKILESTVLRVVGYPSILASPKRHNFRRGKGWKEFTGLWCSPGFRSPFKCFFKGLWLYYLGLIHFFCSERCTNYLTVL